MRPEVVAEETIPVLADRMRVQEALNDLKRAVEEGEMKLARGRSRGVSSMFCGFMDVVDTPKIQKLVWKVWELAGVGLQVDGPFWQNKQHDEDAIVAAARAEIEFMEHKFGL